MMRDKKIHLLLLGYIVSIMMCSLLYGQSKGTIKGRIIDAKTNDGLPSVNVKIKGTYYGAASDMDGNYTIPNINSGSYTIEFALLGYKTVQRTDIRVPEGAILVIDQKMDETVLSLGQEVVIVGEKPLFNPDQTSSIRTVRSEDMKVTLIENVKDVITQQVGVVQTDNEIHIRGGRTSENAYLLDGVSIQDPLAGTGFGLQLSADAIEEVQVITGGFNAEYGQATSGVVNVTTKEGSDKYTGSLGYRRDHIGISETIFRNFNTDAYDGSLSGPEPITMSLLPSLDITIPGTMTFFGNFSGNISDGYTRRVEIIKNGLPTGTYRSITADQLNSSIFGGTRFAPRTDNSWFALGKLTWRISPLMRLTYSYNHSVSINQNSQSLQTNLEYVEASPGYQFEFQNILNNANTYTHDNQFQSIGWTHTLSNKMFYELKLSHYFTHLRADANG
ncbi:MAG: carboxypeptidase-like regulatory domain-containing protein, partial [Bacteroidota bacterium]|nr:carboxypeptidase-like regulatory domain-containing protein [Bacteroidota bacterium]